MTARRFCMITTFYPPWAFGGDAVAVQRLARALVRRGHSVDVIHCVDSYRLLARGPMPDPPPAEPGLTLHSLASPLGALSPLATQQTGLPLLKTRAIRAVLDHGRFDVVHFHNVSLVGGPGVLRLGEGVKLYTAHEHWLVCPTHTLFRMGREACEHATCLRCQLAHRRPPQLWRHTPLLARSLRALDAVIVPSRFTLERHRAADLELPYVIIPPFVDDAAVAVRPDPAAARLPARPYMLFAGRLERLKGLHTVLPLFRSPGPFDLVVAGEGREGDALRRQAAGSARVHFVGRLGPAALAAAYGGALALLVPSLTYETYAQVIVEAHAHGTPVIVRDLGPLPEIAAAGGGLVFRDDAGLAAAMERLAGDRGFRDALGEAGRRAQRAHASEDAVLGRYLALVEEIRARRAPPGERGPAPPATL